MQTKEVYQEEMVTAAGLTKELCELAREHLIGFIKAVNDSEFVFSLPGDVKTFRVCVTEEKSK